MNRILQLEPRWRSSVKYYIIRDKGQHPVLKKMEVILKSRKSPHEKKIALFNCLKSIDVGDLQPLEGQLLNSLLLGKIYNELAQQSMKEYRKLTVKDYSEKKE